MGAALTNPTLLSKRKGNITRNYPVNFRGQRFPDAESAYQALKGRDTTQNDRLMAEIIAAKLQQYPHLLEAIHKRGSVRWLEKCVHFTGARTARFQAWEGRGLESRMIRNLVAGYETATRQTPSK